MTKITVIVTVIWATSKYIYIYIYIYIYLYIYILNIYLYIYIYIYIYSIYDLKLSLLKRYSITGWIMNPSSIQFEILRSCIWFLVCGVTWRRGRFFGSVLYFQRAFDCTLIYFALIFDKKFSCNQGLWALVYDEFVSVSAICVS